MQRKLYYILILFLAAFLNADAQNIRYVSKAGAYTNDGKSWSTAKINIQDAINDLVDNGLTGEVWVAKGTYSPTESTEAGGGNTLFLSFKIPAGIKVYGGFAGTETAKDDRATTDYENIGWFYTNQTILTGDFSKESEFKWNPIKKQYDTSFYGNSYHVVWFAVNGFDEEGRALPLSGEALLEGCFVKDGNAKNSAVGGHPHNAYGGGIYMAEGAVVKNCYISHCEASRDGGGVYMDGGGRLEHCYVAECQSLGVSVDNGYGGGVCIDANASEKPMGISQSAITNCVARMGGGLAINVHSLTSPNGNDIKYKPYASAVVVSNNTATTEGGGVYMNRGGAITQMTIVRNQCNGAEVTSNGVTTGRAAGLYCRDNAYILNSVMWGGQCAANNDIQYATSRSSYDEALKADMKYCSLSKSDFVDWSSTRKVNILSLSSYNSAEDEAAAGAVSTGSMTYPIFFTPSPSAGYIPNGAYKTIHDYHWKVGENSALLNAGMLTVEIDQDGILPFGEIAKDVTGRRFNPRSTLGAYSFSDAKIAPQITAGNVNYYVDSNAEKGSNDSSIGSSWDNPLRFLSNALYHAEQNMSDYSGKTVNIYVKTGTQNNTNSFIYGRIRMIPLNVPSNMNIYGGYPSELTGTNLEQEISGTVYRRNPLLYPTIITGNVTSDYDVNVAHLVTFNGTVNTVFDGFQVRYANASSTLLTNTDKNGAGMSFLNGAQVTVKNMVIAGCTAEQGAAIYADGSSNVTFENCIVHNNASSILKGIIYSEGTSQLSFDHCDFLRNVGYVGYLEGEATRQTYTNSIFFGNMDIALDNTNEEAGGGINHAIPAFAGNTAGVSGSYCMFDNKSASFSSQFGGNPLGQWQYNLQYTFSNGAGDGYPRFLNPTKNTGVSPDGDITFNGSATSFEPHNINPIVNAAYCTGDHTSWGTDISAVTTRDYGGQPDIGAVENHFSTKEAEGENAYGDGQPVFGGVTYVRDYNTYTYNADGTVASVTPDLSTEGRDGTSWAKAINGNASYNISTDHISYTLSYPIASTINNPVPFKIGMLSGNNLNNPVYYAKNQTGQYIQSTTARDEGDDFIFIANGANYYIYNLTKKKYVCYYDNQEGADKIYLSDSNTANALWRLRRFSTNINWLTHLIQPSTTNNNNGSPSWNYNGGTDNNLGLYRGTDPNSKWQLFKKEVETVSDYMNGLQYAVNNAEKMMSESYVQRDTTVFERSSGGNVWTTHTYYDFNPTAGNPLREVWVGAGIYTNHIGYVLRNHVKVYGAFPKMGNPGKEQRHPQLTEGVSMAHVNAKVNVRDYETILQTHASIEERNSHLYDVSVLRHPAECRVTVSDVSNRPANRVVYEGAVWDGFTLRYGYKTALTGAGGGGRRNGGAGLQLYENVLVANCVIRDNLMEGIYGRGAGIYVDGSTIINCYVMNNLASCSNEIFGGGLYMIRGTIYNSIITGNDLGSRGNRRGAGAFFESADFYNNTVVNNKNGGALGVWTASAGDAHLTVYNSIVMGGTNALIDRNNTTPITFKYSFLQSTQNAPADRYFIATDHDQKYCGGRYSADIFHPFAKSYADAIANYDFRLIQKDNYNAVNAGTQFIDMDGDGSSDITLPEYDMDYTERVQDCEVDMGAFEYNGAYSIAPDVTSVAGQAIFYVTPDGHGNASAGSPANAACAGKLQKVIDAAGRYKYNNAGMQVIVKVANSRTLENDGSPFKYAANRTTYEGEQDVRIWSIIVPRGVEVWGGYSDDYTDADDNGFYYNKGAYIDRRDITANPTYFDAYYFNKRLQVNVYTYHVLTFTDKVFDGEGLPYMEGDAVGGPSSFTDYVGQFMSMASSTNDRAVVDGIFITGGNADLRVRASGVTARNINQFGGAAIVTDYAHVRNCIVRNNEGVYGGALALTHKALVSGCLIDRNTADYGGAIYVFENGTELSDGTLVNTEQGDEPAMDANMSHVYTSTIVNNKANVRGGGIWFGQDESNVRVNSTAVWQNESQDQANISGLSNPQKPDGSTSSAREFYPFSYCAAQNIRLAGTNNINLQNLNREGTRFAKKGSTDQKTLAKEAFVAGFDKFNDFGYYGLTNYSILTKTGMAVDEYEDLKRIGLADADFAGTDRFAGVARTFIDIGARSIDKLISSENVMLRLYVMKPEDIDMNAAEAMMGINTAEGTAGYDADKAYYAQEGSSFAYPMQSLQDALDYIYVQRSVQHDGTLYSDGANNLPFEICVSKGVYYPTRDLSGSYGNALDNTFLIPEGVSLIGGFNGKRAVKEDGTDGGDKNFYGRYNKKGTIQPVGNGTYDIQDNITHVTSSAVTVTGENGTYVLRQLPTETMTKNRQRLDINANSIIEPWEFANQTVLSGNVYNIVDNGVLHVISVLPDQNNVGALPYRHYDKSADHLAAGNDSVYTSYEVGQPITLDGLTITGGYARNYIEGTLNDNEKFFYYNGGGLLVDGNRYCDDYNKGTNEGMVYKHKNASNAIAYRDVPLVITKCKFENNRAGYGAALSANTTVSIFSSTFEHNIAESGRDDNVSYGGNIYQIVYPGQGGAIYSTHQLSAFNTMFTNNEAYDAALNIQPVYYRSLRTLIYGNAGMEPSASLGGSGGAVYSGKRGQLHLVNCDFVHNMANAYPAVFTLNPNNAPAGYENFSTSQYNQLSNTLFWGNEVNDEMKNKWSGNPHFNFASQMICNFGKPDRSGAYNPEFEAGNVPSTQEELDAGYQETAWFCAYEDGRGITQEYKKDLRSMEYSPKKHVIPQLKQANGGIYQNCNISIASQNDVLDGPNFVNPSLNAGYAGYVESADWSPSRLNKLTDNGSGKILQRITQVNDTYKAEFAAYASASEIPAERTSYSNETVGDYVTSGAYTTARYLKGYPEYNGNLPLGTDDYMTSSYIQPDGSLQPLYRISYDPNPTHNHTYIDIGVYEYPHTELQYTTVGDEVDILWVSPIEKPDNGLPDGSDWSQPTSDLQRAIETLLASRNGHRKEIRLLDGTYTPIYNIGDRLAFTIDTHNMNESVSLPLTADGQPIEGHGVKSLTIKGGYSRELNNVYDVKEYPAVIRQQNRADATSDTWDHLFYIVDATQRYGLNTSSINNGYNSDNGFGWWPTAELHDNKTVNTIPIEIDGVSLINNQALSGTEGTAIYYADPKFDSALAPTESDSPEYRATAPTTANVAKVVYYKDDTFTEVSDVPTPNFKREGVIYYTDATYTEETTEETPYVRYGYAVNENPAKLIVSKSIIMGSGTHYDSSTQNDNSSSAVYIGMNGGHALLYNDVMHSNYGNPLNSECRTLLVNNTFALNAGFVNITGGDAADRSSIFNSVFWRNNPTGTDTYGQQFSLAGYVDEASSGDIFRYNAFTGGNISATDYSAGTVVTNNFNVGLSDSNSDVINGPNFADPENADIELRSFSINPSLRLLNKGSSDLYNDNLSTAYNIYDIAWLPTTRHDAASQARFVFDIDLGAYEYQNALERVIYVNPNAAVTGLGNSWASPVGHGDLQTAVDLAAVYHVNNPTEEAYVFVKGASLTNADLHTEETLTMRDGVSVFGGISPSYTADCEKIDHGAGIFTFDESVLKTYVADILRKREGVVSTLGNKTVVKGIRVMPNTVFNNTDANIVSLVDGFNVTAATTTNPSGTVTSPVIDIQPTEAGARVALRNIVVHGNNIAAAGTQNIANVNNALIYEALFHDNTVAQDAAVLNIGAEGYAVNITAEGKTVGADGSATYNGSNDAHIYYSLVNYAGQPATENTLSGHNYPVSDANLNYQLTEQSKHIDECPAVNPIASVDALAGFINYSADRDLLGNLRLLNGVTAGNKIDRGAFETWRIDNAAVTTTETNGFYPHEGSVVYIMNGNSLISGHSLVPSYLLLKSGASLYGNGCNVQAAYLGVERQVRKGGAIVSVPYRMNFSESAELPAYDADGVLSLTNDGSKAFAYNGAERASWNYRFMSSESVCWEELTDEADTNSGVLYEAAADAVYRFTGKGTSMTDYIYTEDKDAISKTVTLKQNDDRMSTAGGADFTSKEDMGWNCFGLPYLVSSYNTYAKENFTGNSLYNMDIPHKLWLYYDGRYHGDHSTPAEGDGGYSCVSSWDSSDWHLAADVTPAVWVGEGFFAQTAAVSDTEQLTFYRPVYETSGGAKAINNSGKRFYYGSGIEAETTPTIRITARGHMVYITGMQGDENIIIYDSTGRIYNMKKAVGTEYSTALPATGVYVVKVNSTKQKVLIR